SSGWPQLSHPRRTAPLGPYDAAHGPAQMEPDPGVVDWRRVFAALLRFKWVVVLVTVLGTAGGVVLSRVIKIPYTTHATVWVDVPDVRAHDEGPIQTAGLVGASGWVDLLKSNAVLEDVVRRQRLYLALDSPDDTGAVKSLGVKERVQPGAYRLVVTAQGGRFLLLDGHGVTLQQRGHHHRGRQCHRGSVRVGGNGSAAREALGAREDLGRPGAERAAQPDPGGAAAAGLPRPFGDAVDGHPGAPARARSARARS